ncbi:MAG: hypothetical protein WC584_02820 [Candidatus Pacearchaeota archaeon]
MTIGIEENCKEKTMEERVKLIRVGLEEFAEEDKKYYQKEIDLMKGENFRGRIGNMVSRHANYVAGINTAYQLMCRDFNLDYEPIKSELNLK